MKKQINVEKLIADYQSGKPIGEVCASFHISKQTLYNLLKANRCDLRRQKLYEINGCPLFEKDIYNQIYCMDCGEWEHLSLSFRDKHSKNEHKRKYCNCADYVNCNVYKVMLAQYCE